MKISKNNGVLSFTDDLGNIATVSLKDGSMEEYKVNKEKWFPRKSLTRFFTGINIYELKNWKFEDEKLQRFFTYLADNYYHCHNIGTFVKRMKENEDAEILIKMGFNISSFDQVKTDTLKCVNAIPKDIKRWFINNKYFHSRAIRALKDKIYQDIMRNLMIIDDVEFIKYFLIYWFEEEYSFRTNLHSHIKMYNLEVKRLIPYMYYLYRSERLRGYEYNNFFFDYLKMATVVYPNGRFEKYPKYIKSKHDILINHYNLFKEQFSEELFQKAYEDYNYEYSNSTDKYIILKPKSTIAVKEEGRDLSHCVKSYISKVIDRQTLIYFMRDIKDQDKSLITLEIFDDEIKQVHGEFNRNPNQREMDFLTKFAKNKNLSINKYINVDNQD